MMAKSDPTPPAAPLAERLREDLEAIIIRASVRASITNVGPIDEAVDEILALFQPDRDAQAAEIARLKERLEVDPEHPFDGIAARDETIHQLERRVRELEAANSILGQLGSVQENQRLHAARRDAEAQRDRLADAIGAVLPEMLAVATADPDGEWMTSQRAEVDLWQARLRDATLPAGDAPTRAALAGEAPDAAVTNVDTRTAGEVEAGAPPRDVTMPAADARRLEDEDEMDDYHG